MDDDHDMQIVMGLKDPWKLLFVDMDVAFLSAVAGFLGMTMGLSTMFAIGLGLVVGYGLHSTRKGKPRGYGKHFAYWHFPPSFLRLKRVPPAWAQRTLG
jgi:type IV conjugative transfer system protein TraL